MNGDMLLKPCANGAVGPIPLLIVSQPNGVIFRKPGVVTNGQFEVVGEHARGGLQGQGFSIPVHVGS